MATIILLVSAIGLIAYATFSLVKSIFFRENRQLRLYRAVTLMGAAALLAAVAAAMAPTLEERAATNPAAAQALAERNERSKLEQEARVVAKAEADAAKLAQVERAKAEANAKEAACRSSIRCWGDRHHARASAACIPHVERLSKYSHQWIDGVLEAKFVRFRWHDKEAGIVTYIGDRIQFQNGFGAWQNVIYRCSYDPLSGLIIDVEVVPGRLPVSQ